MSRSRLTVMHFCGGHFGGDLLRLGSHMLRLAVWSPVRFCSLVQVRFFAPKPNSKTHGAFFKTAPRPPRTCLNWFHCELVSFTRYANWMQLKTHPSVIGQEEIVMFIRPLSNHRTPCIFEKLFSERSSYIEINPL